MLRRTRFSKRWRGSRDPASKPLDRNEQLLRRLIAQGASDAVIAQLLGETIPAERVKAVRAVQAVIKGRGGLRIGFDRDAR